MIEDESMKTATYVYPPVLTTLGVTHDIKDGVELSFLHPRASYYKGQLQHTEHGVVRNKGVIFAEKLMERLENIQWFKESIENTKIPVWDIIYRFSTTESCRDMFLNIINVPEVEIPNMVHQNIDQFLHHVRYGSGEMLSDYISEHEIDWFQTELEKEIVILLKEERESPT